jgi:hypothetical protein
MASKNTVVGLVSSHEQAETIVNELQRAGFSKEDVSALFPDKKGTRDFAHEKNTKAPEGTIGLLAGIGALAIPGLGPFIAAGPIMAALSGAAAGATLGGVAGALVGMGIPELEAKRYEGKIKDGNILLSVHVDGSEERDSAKKIFQSGGATDVTTTGEKSIPKSQRPAASSR